MFQFNVLVFAYSSSYIVFVFVHSFEGATVKKLICDNKFLRYGCIAKHYFGWKRFAVCLFEHDIKFGTLVVVSNSSTQFYLIITSQNVDRHDCFNSYAKSSLVRLFVVRAIFDGSTVK